MYNLGTIDLATRRPASPRTNVFNALGFGNILPAESVFAMSVIPTKR